MWEWLLSPIDPSRLHDVRFGVSWHGRSMVLAWGVIAPVAVIIARFFKIWPGQDWPRELDNQTWWRCHWMGQTAVLTLSLIGVALVMPPNLSEIGLHAALGYLVLIMLAGQGLLGLFRGSKGGPSEIAKTGTLRGHHYDMTPWRRVFEWLHKAMGYASLGLAAAVILLGLWTANGPVWMWITIPGWWVLLAAVFVTLQRQGRAVDTYQAIWGPDPSHPGNRMRAPGWGVRRPGDEPMAPPASGDDPVRTQ